MLLVTIEMLPGGFEPMSRKIASIRISNLSNLHQISDYQIQATENANPLTGTPLRTTECMVRDHNRHQSVWALLKSACDEIVRADLENP
ncbi:hypothetical protein JOE51_004147 [Bradyrhizobium japonicum]|uniref:hypothetical protein n=1 Tax=Bradyrhizobium sp. B024 TaxID=3140247 RepID=UPI001B3FE878|nr:hypothetical protein [Bradyrhizobium japonicum]